MDVFFHLPLREKALTLALETLQDCVEGLTEFTQPAVRTVMGIELTASWRDRTTWPTPEEAADAVLTGRAAETHHTLPDGVEALLTAFTDTLQGVPEATESDIRSTATRMSNALRTFQETLGGDAEGYRVADGCPLERGACHAPARMATECQRDANQIFQRRALGKHQRHRSHRGVRDQPIEA